MIARRFKITKSQLDEVISSDLMFSTKSTTPFAGSEVGLTEPVGNADFGEISTTDDRANSMPPSPIGRAVAGSRGYIGSIIY